MKQKKLPPLEVGTAYVATDFQRFEYFGRALIGGSRAILRLHLKNATTIDLPATDDELKNLAIVLTEAFGLLALDYPKALVTDGSKYTV